MIASIRNSLSGLKAGAKVLAASASNVASARKTALLDEVAISAVSASHPGGEYDESSHDPPYSPRHAVHSARAGGGVTTAMRGVDPSHVAAFDPGDPNADGDGRVARANVDLADEILRTRRARTLYDANLKALRTEDEMLGGLIDDRA